MAKSIKDLDLKVADLKNYFNDELGRFKGEIAKIKSPTVDSEPVNNARLADVLNSFDLFRAAVDNRLKSLESQVNELRVASEGFNAKLDTYVQHGNRNKILVFGIEEKSSEISQREVIETINTKLKIQLGATDIDLCYRIGKKRDGVARPLLVEFVCIRKRNEIYYNKKLLKGSEITIAEVLSPMRFELYKLVRQKFGKECWVNRGRIGLKFNDRVEYITSVKQFHAIVSSAACLPTEDGAP